MLLSGKPLAILGCVLALILVAISGPAKLRAFSPANPDVSSTSHSWALPLNTLDRLEVENSSWEKTEGVRGESVVVTYRGRRAVRVINFDGENGKPSPTGAESLAIVKASDFRNGIIEIDVAGVPREGAAPKTRGFVGIAFRVQNRGEQYESFYLRMENARANDQLQRNHSAQYESKPNYPWFRLREENPGGYESYVDLDEGAWTKIKVVVNGTKAQLYVNGAAHPCLIVNDLKLGDAAGQIALFTGSDTEAYFSRLTVTNE